MRRNAMAVAALVLAVTGAQAADLVGVRGTDTHFTTTMNWTVNGKPVKLLLTGVALRTRFFVNVYSIASYVQEGVNVRSPEDLATVDAPKQLHLVMERTVDGKDMAEAFRTAIRMNHPEPELADEVATLVDKLQSDTAVKGDHIYITHLPGVGLEVKVAGRSEFVIKSPNLTRAIWDIYLGRYNLGEGIRHGLTSRLPG